MSLQIPVTLKDDVADTLFIPLYMRHLETLRKNGIIHDPVASELVSRINYDFSKYNTATKSLVGTAIRVRQFDAAASRFLEAHDNPVIISIGAGLDTRFQRVYQGKGVFYELDLPEVIAFRSKLLSSSPENPYLPVSMFDYGWMEEVVWNHANANFAIIAEGVFMYFDEMQIKELVRAIAEKFGGGELHFDACSSYGVRNSHKHDTVKFARARFKWAMDDDRILEQWCPNLKHAGTAYYMTQEKQRWGMMAILGMLVPPLKNAFRMLHYDII